MNTLRFLSLALLAGVGAGSFVGGASAKPAAAAKAAPKGATSGRAAVAPKPAAKPAAAAAKGAAIAEPPVAKARPVSTSVVYPSSADLIPQGRYLWEKLTSLGKTKRTAIITGASSGLGRQGARSLVESGEWHVVFACRDTQKACEVAAELGLKTDDYTVMKLDLASLGSVRQFVKTFEASGRPCDALVCNAAVYLPNQPGATFTEDGFEESMGVNHLGHFLLVNLMLPIVEKSDFKRVVIVGSITGNTNTLGGGFVWPRADLGELQGWEQTLASPEGRVAMADGGEFDGAKAYKDAKLCNMLTVNELNRRYHESTGITFSTLYPGCIATTNLFRQKRDWFRVWFPLFQKYVIGGFVSEEEAGDRLAQVVSSEGCKKSGVYWSWNGKAQGVGTLSAKDGFLKPQGAGGSGGEIFEGELSKDASSLDLALRIWESSAKLVGLDK